MTDEPKILFLDIETSLILAYTFGIRDQHITHKAIANDRDGKLIHCVGLKFRGKRGKVLSEWEHGYEGMMQGVHDALSEADAVATYNGARFDIPKIHGQFALLGMDLPPPPTQIDLYKSARKLGYICNKLDYLAPLLGLGCKVPHEGLQLWIDTFNGCPKAQKTMARYCLGDVKLTEEVYERLMPYIPNHPRLHHGAGEHCGACGSDKIQYRGWYRTKASKRRRIHCTECGGWELGSIQRVA